MSRRMRWFCELVVLHVVASLSATIIVDDYFSGRDLIQFFVQAAVVTGGMLAYEQIFNDSRLRVLWPVYGAVMVLLCLAMADTYGIGW